MPERTYKTIKVSPPAHRRLTGIKQGLQAEKGRDVTFSEIIEIMADALIRDQGRARRAGEEGQ
jgi:hypothetical protein